MDLSEVRIAVGLNVDLFRGIINYLYTNETIPHTMELGLLQISIDEPIMEIRDASTTPRLGLHITGDYKNGADPFVGFDIWVRLQPFVRTISGATPVAALSAAEVEDASPEGIGDLVGMFAIGQLNEILQNMDIPIFDSLINGLEEAAFGEDVPERSTWSTNFYLGRTAEIEYVEVGFPRGEPQNPMVRNSEQLETTTALIATLAMPGQSANLPNNPSIVPAGTGIQIMISRAAMDSVLALNARKQLEENIDGATLNFLSMSMHDLGIQIVGSAEKSNATISWDGILLLFFRKFYTVKGSKRWHDGFTDVFASGINVDVDMPWYIKLARGILAILGPIGWILDANLIAPKVGEANEEAPNVIRGAFKEEVGAALRNMIGNVGGLSGDDAIPFMQFSQNSWVLNGHYTHSLLAFAGLNRDTIANIEHDVFNLEGAYGESVGMIDLASGYNLHPQELGRLLKSDIFRIPNVHGVKADFGYYVRSNPNDDTADNLVDPAEIHTE